MTQLSGNAQKVLRFLYLNPTYEELVRLTELDRVDVGIATAEIQTRLKDLHVFADYENGKEILPVTT